ncbi:MAG: TIGR02147 family protein [Oligoflexus sp.]
MSNKAKLRAIAAEYPPTRFFSCKDFLRQLHVVMKAQEERYSFRQLAEDLGFSATNIVHLFVQGKRPISEQAAARIIEALALRKDERLYFFALAKLSGELSADEVSQVFAEALDIRSRTISSRLDQERYRYYSAWYHVVIREMLALPDFQADPKWIAAKVWPKISVKEAEESLDLLKQLQLIRLDKKTDRWLQSEPTLSTGPEVTDLAVTAYHLSAIPQGLNALATIDQKKRHISALTLCVSEEQLERMKKEIEIFQQKLLDLEKDRSGQKPDRVLQLNMQLYPSTLT